MEDVDIIILRGSSVPRGTRRPKAAGSRRVCAARGCHTVLSRYNLANTCHQHTPVRYPRIRGSMASS
jgi:hypothetical protein